MKDTSATFNIIKSKKRINALGKKTGAQNVVPGKLATKRTEKGHKYNTKTNPTISTKRTKEQRKTEEEMEGPTSP